MHFFLLYAQIIISWKRIIILCVRLIISSAWILIPFARIIKSRAHIIIYFLPLFDRPKINIVFSNTLKFRSCIANQIYNSKTIL